MRPIVYGLVHSETAPSLITKLAIAPRDEKFTKVLLDLLALFGGVDPRTKCRVAGGPRLWDEMGRIRAKRNHVVHQAEVATEDEAQLAIAVAACMVEELFPAVVGKLGLHLKGTSVCDWSSSPLDGGPY